LAPGAAQPANPPQGARALQRHTSTGFDRIANRNPALARQANADSLSAWGNPFPKHFARHGRRRAMSAIRTQSLTKIYQGRHIALNCVDLQVEPGAVLGILGNNGAGKTTLVKLLLGLQTPTAGRVQVFGQAMGPNAARLRRRMGYVPAIPRFPAGMTPLMYLDYVGKLQGLTRRERGPRIANLLRAADLQRSSGAAIPMLSTGMGSKLAIIASLVGDPDLLIWDEPAQGLDTDARRSMLELLQKLAEKKTLVLCSHHLADIRQVCTQLLLLDEGEVKFSGPVEGLKAKDAPVLATLELLGDRKALAEALKLIQETEDIDKAELARTTMRVTVAAGASVCGAMTNVLVHLQDKSVEVAELQLAGALTERAISQLLHEEGSRGLTRAYRPVRG
jgi:ABC-2 type transport system ATP-binding protein